MEQYIEIITINLIPGGMKPACHASQYDKGRVIRANLVNGLTPYSIKSGDVFTLNVKKPDGNIVTVEVEATVGNTYVDFSTTEQMCAVAGKNNCEFSIENGSDLIGTANFFMIVEASPLEGGIESESEINNLTRQVHDIVVEELEDNGAEETGYDNTESGLEATNVQDAIDEVNAKIENIPSVDAYTKEQSDQKYATKTALEEVASDIPTKTSELNNDSGFTQIDDAEASASKTYSSNKVENIVAPINKQVGYINDDISLLYDKNSTFAGGTIDATTGALNTAYAPYYKATDYINVSGLTSLYFWSDILTSPTNVFGCAFYDSDKVFASGIKFNKADVASTEKRLVKVPDNAVYFRTCCRIAEVNDFFVANNTFRVLEKEINEIKRFVSNFGMQLFEKIGVIGDSLSCGWSKDKNGNNSRRNTGISWVQQLARRLGCEAYNLGASGVDPVDWFKPDFEYAQYCYTQYQSVGFCDLYIIGLGLNGGTLGTIADINENDYTQNASTFYGQYARIIQMINAEHPTAKVICLTEPTTRISGYDTAVRNICGLNYIKAELLDLEKDYFDIFNTPELLAELQPDGLHFTPYGYSIIAEAMLYAVNDYISKHSANFKYVGVATV